MLALSDIGTVIEVLPWDEIGHKTSDKPGEYLSDRRPFRFRVEGGSEDGQISFGLFGPITVGPGRYQGLNCSIMVPGDGSDWRLSQQCQANVKVGPTKARRDYRFDFRHPEGTTIDGYPVIRRFGSIEVVDENFPRPSGLPPQVEAIWRGGLKRGASGTATQED